jgi:hypothetical protein
LKKEYMNMTINLRDIPTAVQDYLNTKVTVTISDITPSSGNTVQPGETFTFKVDARNNGGVALNNVHYHVSVEPSTVAMLIVPSTASGKTTDVEGNTLTPGTAVGAMIFNPADGNFADRLGVDEGDTINFTGKARAQTEVGGRGTLQAKIVANIDQVLLFPRGEETPSTAKEFQVVG